VVANPGHPPGKESKLESATVASKSARVDCKVELVNEHPHEALNVTEQHGARMIVVGSHGENPIKGAIVGSTPYKLVQLSKVPVLVVRP
jgi:nucleotide-binding universal stress UspA family protein